MNLNAGNRMPNKGTENKTTPFQFEMDIFIFIP